MRVSTGTVEQARARAVRRPTGPVEQQRWDRLVGWASTRPPDRRPARAAALRELLGAGLGPADPVAAAARLLAEDVTGEGADAGTATATAAGDAALAARVHARCRAWLAEDVAEAAPLLALFTGHHRDPEGGPVAPDPDLVSRLRGWLAQRVGPPGASADVRTIAGGFSRLMLDVRWGDGGRAVVRVEQDGMFATEGAREAAVMQAVAEHGYPVPRVRWREPDPAVLGAPFFVMAHVEGTARTDAGALDHMVRSLADLHALPAGAAGAVAALDGVRSGSARAAVDAQLDHWHRVYRAAVTEPIPLLERGFAWLRAHLPLTGPAVVVHGDPGPGNVLQHAGGVAAVLDWELAHAGDAAEDWAYLAIIRGRKVASADEWKARLRAVAGVEYDPATWDAWEAYNSVKGACVNLTALEVFRRSPTPTPDMLAIGIAVHLRFLARVAELT